MALIQESELSINKPARAIAVVFGAYNSGHPSGRGTAITVCGTGIIQSNIMETIKFNSKSMYVKHIGNTSALLVDDQEKEHRVPVWALGKASAGNKVGKSRKGGKA